MRIASIFCSIKRPILRFYILIKSIHPSILDPIWPFEMNFTDTYDTRLLDTTSPVEYWLNIIPNLQTGTFDADVTIEIVANKDTQVISLHSEGLNIIEASVTSDDTNATSKSTSRYPRRLKSSIKPVDEGKDILIITMDKPLSANRHYKVRIVFTGYLYENNPFGFALYHDKHEDESNYRT